MKQSTKEQVIIGLFWGWVGFVTVSTIIHFLLIYTLTETKVSWGDAIDIYAACVEPEPDPNLLCTPGPMRIRRHQEAEGIRP